MFRRLTLVLFAGLSVAAAVGIVAAPPAAPVAYSRSLYKHWVDTDRDCQDTRQEVLIIESVVPVTLDGRGCKVLRGEWHDPYTGLVFTNPAQLDVDHMVPLAEAHKSGGFSWSPSQRQDYANNLGDPNTLIAVSLSANRSKSDKDPARWLPRNITFRCTYVRQWLEVKARWNLRMDAEEQRAIDEVLATCTPAIITSNTAPSPRLRPPQG